MIYLINRARRQAAPVGVVGGYALDQLASPSLVAGSWSFEKAFASAYNNSNDILGAKMYTTGTEEGFSGSEVEAGDVLTWTADPKVVITDLYDQLGSGNDWSTSILSRMPVFIDSSAQIAMTNGHKAAEFINGYGLEITGLGLTGTNGAMIIKMKGGADISYRILFRVGNHAPFITYLGNGSACYSGCGNPDYEVNGVAMSPETRGELHTQTSGVDVVLYISNIDWSVDSAWSTGSLELAYQGDPRISAITIWDDAPPAGDITLMKDAYAL